MKAGLFRRTLLALDSAETSRAAAEFAVRMANETGCEVHALYAVDTPTIEYLSHMRVLIAEEVQEFERDLQTTAERYIEYLRVGAERRGVAIHARIRRGALHQLVQEMAAEIEADAIVLGGWKCSAVQKDNAAASRQLVIENASCPVIVVQPGPAN